MNLAALTEIEEQIARFSPDEQLWLIERLVHRLRQSTPANKGAREGELAAMAADPDIWRELQQIDTEFKTTEGDNLEKKSGTAEPRVLLVDIDWQGYQEIGDVLRERPALRLTYDRGSLEIKNLSPEHEEFKHVFVLLFAVLALELRLPMKGRGSMTFQREDLDRGLEPDECYWIKNEARVRGKTQIDFRQDPPPDLVVEIDITRSSLPRMDIYAALGVPEVWRFDGQALHVYHLGADAKYQAAPSSLSFPALPAAELTRFVLAGRATDDRSLMESFQTWVREQLARKGP
jgi:Uma2 family endonuclease